MLAVTGASGFLGRHLVSEARSRGLAVRALVGTSAQAQEELERLGVAVVRGRLAEPACAAKLLEGADALIHLAALGVQSRDRDWARTAHVNIVEPLAWIERAAKSVRRVVAVGTCLEYRGLGSLPEKGCPESQWAPLDEESSLEARDAYGATKAAGGLLLRALARERGLPMWYLRIASLYGPGDDAAKLIPGAIAAARARTAFETTAGEQIREWLHVQDAVSAVLAAAEREPPQGSAVLNVGTGVGVATAMVVRRIFEAAGAPSELVRTGARPYRQGEVHYLVMTCTKAREILGFAPATEMDDFLREHCAPGATVNGRLLEN